MRKSNYRHVSKHLEALSDKELSELLEQATPVHSGTGGSSVKLEIDGVPVFVKQIPLNDTEASIRSTKNIFELPLYYQYGVGSAGFNIWREIDTHKMSTEWVLNGENHSFPLMYHWRVLKNSQEKPALDDEELNGFVKFWGNSQAIGERIKANHSATANLTLFIEHVPDTLQSWLENQFNLGTEAFDQAVSMVERNLNETISFINAKGLLHFDPHFRNILTDGERLYFSDFGLANSSQFDLSKEETEFFHSHKNYDRSYAATVLANLIIAKTFGEECYEEVMKEFAEGKVVVLLTEKERFTPLLLSIVKRYASIAVEMNNFLQRLLKDTRHGIYPKEELEKYWAKID